MSFEILEQVEGATTVFAPLNTTIDADRDYGGLMELDACACGGQPGIADRRQLLSLRQQLGEVPRGPIGLPAETVARMRSRVCGYPVRVDPDGSVPSCTPLQGVYQDFDLPDGLVNLGEDMNEPGHGDIHPWRVVVLGGVMVGMWWAFTHRNELGW